MLCDGFRVFGQTGVMYSVWHCGRSPYVVLDAFRPGRGRKGMAEPVQLGSGAVIFDSKFGNTEKVPRSLARGLEMAGLKATCVNAKDVQIDSLGE